MDKTYVSLKCDAKTIFDPKLKPAVLDALEKAITKAVNANSKFTTSTKSKVSIFLSAVVVSVTLDDKDKPTKMEAKLTIDGTLLGATGQAFKASGSAAMSGLNPKNPGADAAALVDDAASDLMKTRVLPQMVKMVP